MQLSLLQAKQPKFYGLVLFFYGKISKKTHLFDVLGWKIGVY